MEQLSSYISRNASALMLGHGRPVPRTPVVRVGGYDVHMLHGSDARREGVERELDAAGVALPLQDRQSWRDVDTNAESVFGVVRDSAGRPACGFNGRIGRSRAYPGLSIVRVQRFGGECGPVAAHAAIESLSRWAHSNRVLRLHLEVHTTSDELKAAVAEACSAFGFRRGRMRSYERTVMLDVTSPPEIIFGSLHATARRHIRAVDKRPVEIRVIDDPDLSGRMNELLRESLERTGARFKRQPFAQLIRFASEHPLHARIVGLFRRDATGPDALLAFAVGYHHGTHAEYGHAGCTRQTDVRMPLMYGLAWDLILWSRENGARWFDFGGIKEDGCSDDATEGIADFKRYFVRDVVDVGEEWVLEPRPFRGAVARGIVSVATWASTLLDGTGWLKLAPKRSAQLELSP